jgi:uncharacterized repeat protein (TIGR01451 family)
MYEPDHVLPRCHFQVTGETHTRPHSGRSLSDTLSLLALLLVMGLLGAFVPAQSVLAQAFFGADLALTKTGSPNPVTVGEPLTYILEVTNNGPDNATGVTVTDNLPANVTFVSATPNPGGTCSGAATVTCLMGSLNGGATVTIVVTPTSVGELSNTARVDGDQDDPNNPLNNSDTELTTVVSRPTTTLTVVKTVINDDGGSLGVGDFPLFMDGAGVASGMPTDVAPGAHTVSEFNQPGYTAGPFGGDCAADGSVSIGFGENKTCTITNDDQPPIDRQPEASNVSISGIPQVGQVLTGNYTYADVDGDLEGASTFRWLRDGAPIAGATNRDYALVVEDAGALIRFEVTPVAETGASPGPAATSEAVGPVTVNPDPDPIPEPPTASNVSISGIPQVGQVLTGNYTYADLEGDFEGASIFRWLRDGTPIAGATDRAYALVVEDVGALIHFNVTPVAQTGPSPGSEATSPPVGPVTSRPDMPTPPTASNVSISGIPQVGEVLTGNYTYADLEGDFEGASTFRWLRNGIPIAGATARAYALVVADVGALIRFEVTPVALSGPSPGPAATSPPVGPIIDATDPPTPPTASNVSISGIPQVGGVLTGSYTYADLEGDLEGASTFRWLRNGTPITGATDRTYALVAADEGALIRFEVTPVARSGPSPGLAARSAPVGPVTLPPTPPEPAGGLRPVATCEVRGGCAVRLTCQDPTTACTSDVRLTVRARDVRLGRDPSASARARRRITFASSVVNVPPGQTDVFQLRLTRNGRKNVRQGKMKRLRGRLEVRNTIGATVSNTPITIRLRAFRPR